MKLKITSIVIIIFLIGLMMIFWKYQLNANNHEGGNQPTTTDVPKKQTTQKPKDNGKSNVNSITTYRNDKISIDKAFKKFISLKSLNAQDWKYDGNDKLGGYKFKFIKKVEYDHVNFTVDPLDGNVYVERNGVFAGNIFEKNIIPLKDDEVTQLIKKIILKPMPKACIPTGCTVAGEGYEQGNDLVMVYVNTNDYSNVNVLKEYKVNVIGGEIFEYKSIPDKPGVTGKKIGDIRSDTFIKYSKETVQFN